MVGLDDGPATLATFTIAPPRGMRGSAARHARKGPRRFRSMTLSQPAVRVSASAAKNCCPPATWISTSSLPESPAARATTASTAASSAASVGATSASGAPALRAVAATSSRSPVERAASTRLAPACAQTSAACLPIPRLAPMTRTVLPSSRNLASGGMASLSIAMRSLLVPSATARGAPPAPALPSPFQLREMPVPAGSMPVAALLRAAFRPHHQVQRAGEDLLVAAGAAVGLERPVGLHHPQVPAVRHPLKRPRLAAEPPAGALVERHRGRAHPAGPP